MEQESSNPEEKKDAIADYYEGYQQLELQSAETNIRKARNAIFAIAIVFFISELVGMGAANTITPTGLLVVGLLSGVFVGLAFLTRKQPLTAILLALVLFVGLWIFAIILAGPEHLYRGLLVRIPIIYFLIKGIKHARDAERIRKVIKEA